MKFLLGVAAFCLAIVAPAQTVKLQTYTLANGLKVILHEDHGLPMVTVNILYHVGSKDEPDRRSGFAHLFEHLMFMGTNRVPTGQYDNIMEGGGGWNNADTTEDRTDFYDVGPSNMLPTLLWLEADRLETLGKNMTQKKLDLQRDVVKNGAPAKHREHTLRPSLRSHQQPDVPARPPVSHQRHRQHGRPR